MKQVRVRLVNRHRDFQNKPHTSFSNKKHKYLIYRYAYKVDISVVLPVKYKRVERELTHGDLTEKVYVKLIGKNYNTFNNNRNAFYITSVVQIPVKQNFGDGLSYNVLNKEAYTTTNSRKYRDIQQTKEYKINTIIKI